jgi:Co/Zn/Cd efflux system component
MHSHSIAPWTHGHAFLGERHDRRERRTWSVVALTAFMMAAEITGGTLFGWAFMDPLVGLVGTVVVNARPH